MGPICSPRPPHFSAGALFRLLHLIEHFYKGWRPKSQAKPISSTCETLNKKRNTPQIKSTVTYKTLALFFSHQKGETTSNKTSHIKLNSGLVLPQKARNIQDMMNAFLGFLCEGIVCFPLSTQFSLCLPFSASNKKKHNQPLSHSL